MTDKELEVFKMLSELEGLVPGFPETPQKLTNVTKAIASLVTFQPARHRDGVWNRPGALMPKEQGGRLCHEDGDHNRAFCPECGAERMIDNPAAWLIENLKHRCRWWPSLMEIREFYCGNFPPADLVERGEEIGGRPRRAIQED